MTEENPIEPTQVWTAEEWDNWQAAPNSRSRRYQKYDTFRRMYSGRFDDRGLFFDVET